MADESLWKGEVAQKILNKVYSERLSDLERRVLQFVSLFRDPVHIGALVAVSNDPAWTDAFAKKLAVNLCRKSLLNNTQDNYWEESLIHGYAYGKICDHVFHHKLACDYYLSLPIMENPTKKEDFQPLIEAHYHACMAKEYDKASKIIFDNRLDYKLDNWGNYRTLVEIYSLMLPTDTFRDKPLLSETRHSRILGDLGNTYNRLGEYQKAIKYYNQALEIAKQTGDKGGESFCLGNLGIDHHSLGDYQKSIKYLIQALEIAKQIGDKQKEGLWLNNIGYVLSFDEKKIKEYLACYLLARQIRVKLGNSTDIAQTQSNIKALESKLGEKEFAILLAEVEPKAEEIVREMMEAIADNP